MKVQVRVSKEDADLLQARSVAVGIPLTEYAGTLLTRAFYQREAEAGEEVLIPLVRRAVRAECNRFLDRIMEMMVRNYMEAGTARRLIEAAMVFPAPQSKAFIKELESINWDAAYDDLREDIRGIGDWRALIPPEGEGEQDGHGR
ncbi:hypothetical protein [Deinococcus hopiensis]|uniref:hypothetical protein n=1 Tax=Deinococcus hopiensis TaxID=309885 RepID=UPI00111C532A|nr:hypothetical protein [Deinococcus hopiensis]